MTLQVPSWTALSGESATADENDCTAFNAAFSELGFSWRWTIESYCELARIPGDRERLRFYLETEQPQLLSTHDADFLIDALHSAKLRQQSAIFGDDGGRPAGDSKVEAGASQPRRQAPGSVSG